MSNQEGAVPAATKGEHMEHFPPCTPSRPFTCKGNGWDGVYQIIDRLCHMLATAAIIIKKQAEILAMHSIATESGELEHQWQQLLTDIEGGQGPTNEEKEGDIT